jgi:hypothetical protein
LNPHTRVVVAVDGLAIREGLATYVVRRVADGCAHTLRS